VADGSMPRIKRARFKPTNRARSKDYVVSKIPHAQAAPFIVTHHYAHGCANTSTEAFGLFKAGTLVGAALWMPPTRVAAESVDRNDWRRVLALSRLAVAPTEPTNAESLFIGAMLRTLNAERRWTCVLTYADESQGHDGTIYRATNWRYLGRTKPEPRWLDANGKQVSKLATKTRKAADMRQLGHRMVGKFHKHKFARILDVGIAQALVRAFETLRDRCATHPIGTAGDTK
jgi:hypothetical protein